MSILSQIANTHNQTGLKAVITGVEKVGKTTLATNAPRTLLVPLEQGAIGLSVMSTPLLSSMSEVFQLLDEILAVQFPYQSVVFDSATALERLIHTSVLQADPIYSPNNAKALTMESALGGYGKAYQYATEVFQRFLHRCDLITAAGINVILTCHVFAAKVLDPAFGEYDTWDLLLHSPKNQKSYGKREMLTQWADLIGFLHEPLFVTESDKTDVKRGVSLNRGRILAVNRTPGYVAGNRFNVCTDVSIPFQDGWNHLALAIHESSGRDFFNRDKGDV